MSHKRPLGAFLRRNPFPHPYTEGFYFREKMRAIHRTAPDAPFAEILELGGGRSGLTATLYPGARVVNVDIDPAFAADPPNRDPRMRFVHGDATDLPFPDASFDAVTLFDVIEHIPDDDAAAREVRRVLRPGGAVLITTPNETWRFPWHRPLAPLCRSDLEMMAEWGHARRGYTIERLAELMGAGPAARSTFITPVTSVCHDLSLSRLPSPARRALCSLIAPVTWSAYWLHRDDGPGTETATCWYPPPAARGEA